MLYRGLLQVVLFTVRRYNVLNKRVWFCNVTLDLYRENCHATGRHCTDWTAWLEWLLYHLQWLIWFIVIRQTKHDLKAVYYFSDPTNVGFFFTISLPLSADSAKINIISTNGKQDAARRLQATRDKHGFLCYIFSAPSHYKSSVGTNFPILAIAFSH